jgi:glycine/D-amino acid oxidase-like deaminating enzyme
VEQFQIGNQNGSSHESVKQFRQPHSEKYLVELANMSIPLWRKLEQNANLPNGSILNLTDGFLIIGDPAANLTTVEGNFNQIRQNCDELGLGCIYLTSEQLHDRYPLFHLPSNYNGIFHQNSGYINVTQLMIALVQIIQTNYSKNIIIRENEEFFNLDPSVSDTPDSAVRLVTNRGSLMAKKVLYVPGPYAKNVSLTLGFDLQMTMWELPDLYFPVRSPYPSPTPTWFAVGSNVQSHFHGYPMEATEMPGYMKITPEFIKDMDNPLIYPKDREGPTESLTQYFIQQVRQWIIENAPSIDPDPAKCIIGQQTCLATFVPDYGFIIDYLPTGVPYRDKVMMSAAGWGMKFAPIFADILVNLIFGTVPPYYSPYIPEFSFDRGNRIIPFTSTPSPISTTLSPEKPEKLYKTITIVLSIFFGLALIVIIVLAIRRCRRRSDLDVPLI